MKLAFFLLVLCTFYSCSTGVKQKDIDEILDIDSDFSNYSKKYGYTAAQEKFYDSTKIVVLRNNQKPQKGSEFFEDLKNNKAFYENFTYTCQAYDAEISGTKDMATVRGIYTLLDNQSLSETKGSYLNVWMKNKKGEWKIITDVNTVGIEPVEENTTEETNNSGLNEDDKEFLKRRLNSGGKYYPDLNIHY